MIRQSQYRPGELVQNYYDRKSVYLVLDGLKRTNQDQDVAKVVNQYGPGLAMRPDSYRSYRRMLVHNYRAKNYLMMKICIIKKYTPKNLA